MSCCCGRTVVIRTGNGDGDGGEPVDIVGAAATDDTPVGDVATVRSVHTTVTQAGNTYEVQSQLAPPHFFLLGSHADVPTEAVEVGPATVPASGLYDIAVEVYWWHDINGLNNNNGIAALRFQLVSSEGGTRFTRYADYVNLPVGSSQATYAGVRQASTTVRRFLTFQEGETVSVVLQKTDNFGGAAYHVDDVVVNAVKIRD